MNKSIASKVREYIRTIPPGGQFITQDIWGAFKAGEKEIVRAALVKMAHPKRGELRCVGMRAVGLRQRANIYEVVQLRDDTSAAPKWAVFWPDVYRGYLERHKLL